MPKPRRELITTADAADLLGVNVATLNRWAAGGIITPVFKAPGLRGVRLYDPEDVLELAQGR